MHQIKVKVISRGGKRKAWRAQTPECSSIWGNCSFIFDNAINEYDWLVVIDDISRHQNAPSEICQCADAHTLLVTTEPPSITRYGRTFSAQFTHVLTSQNEQALPHPNRIHSHTGNLWYNGHSFDEVIQQPLPPKSASISTVCSSKRQRHTIHNKRYEFTQWLKQRVPELEIFGHGVRFIKHKYDALDPYRYHLAVENHIASHHWTEKLADPFLSGSIPIYYGCPNAGDYFPKDSFVPININNPQESLQTIQTILADPDDYAKRLDALKEAQRLVLHEYNLLAMLNRVISEHYNPNCKASARPLYNRKQMRLRHPRDLMSHLWWDTKRTLNRLKTEE